MNETLGDLNQSIRHWLSLVESCRELDMLTRVQKKDLDSLVRTLAIQRICGYPDRGIMLAIRKDLKDIVKCLK